MRPKLMTRALSKDTRHTSKIGYAVFFAALIAVQALPPVG